MSGNNDLVVKKLRMDINEDAQEPVETKLYTTPTVLSFSNLFFTQRSTQ